MRVLIVTSKYSPAVGGLEHAVRNISEELKRKGHNVSILTNRYSLNLKPKELIDGIEVERLFFTDGFPRTKNLWVWFKYFIRLALAPVSLGRLIFLLKQKKFDVVHLHFVSAPAHYLLIARKFIKFTWVTSLHGADVEDFDRKSKRQQKLLRETLQTSDFITANAVHLLEEALLKTNVTIQEKKREIVPMGFSPSVAAEAKKIGKNYIFSAGRFVHKKGFDILIKAFARIALSGQYAGHLFMAGDGEEIENCRKIAKELGIEARVNFLGMLNQKDIISYLKECDLFIMPSRLEAFGITLLEALYAGKKVVASKVGGMVELMRDNPHYLVAADDPGALSDKIIWALRDNSWRSIDREKLIKQYSWERVANSYLSIYESITIKKL